MDLVATLLTRWRCRRLRARLVDLAEGVAFAGSERVERHAAGCAECGAALAALREVPAALRAAPADGRDDAFWERQRQGILRAAFDSPAPPAAPFRQTFGDWRTSAAATLAAAALLLLALRLPHTPVPFGPEAGAADAARLDAEDLAAALTSIAPGTDLLAGDDVPLSLADEADPSQPSALHDFDDDELEALTDLVGIAGAPAGGDFE